MGSKFTYSCKGYTRPSETLLSINLDSDFSAMKMIKGIVVGHYDNFDNVTLSRGQLLKSF